MTTSRHPNLEGAFAPPKGRGEALAGLLAPRQRPGVSAQARAADAAPQPEHADAAPQLEPAPVTPVRRGRRPATAERRGTATSEPSVKNIAIYLPPTTLAAARTVSRHRDITYADLLVDAFADVDDATLAAHFAAEAHEKDHVGMPRRSPRTSGVAGIQRQFRLTSEQVEWLDTQVRAFNAPSRSALAAAVLGLHLGTVTE